MELDIELIRDNFALILERNPNPTARFYEILFERYPSAKPLFGRNSQRAQETMLAQALVAVVDHLDDSAWLSQTLGALGAKHVDYGVSAEMFDWVGDALLRTLAEVSGADWSPKVEANWAAAYGVIVKLMLAGMARESA